MGSVNAKTVNGDDEDYAVAVKAALKKSKIPLHVKTAHYTPSIFPITPLISGRTCSIINESWQLIVKTDVADEMGNKTSGITAFYNDFYDRLDILDSSGRFDAVLSLNVAGTGTNRIQAKGAILVRIIKYLTKIEGDTENHRHQIVELGKSHAKKKIRPWQYAIFAQTMLLTISSRLGTAATTDVMEAWVNMLAFVMKHMLPHAIEHAVIATEINVNTSAEFRSQKLRQDMEVEELLAGKGKKKAGNAKLVDEVSVTVTVARRG